MKGGTQTGIALGVGYALGRRHKLRMAAMLAIAASSGGLGALGSAVMKRGMPTGVAGGLLGKVTPQVGGIGEKIRGELINAGKAAAVAAVSNRVESLSDSLAQRAETIRGPGRSSQDAEDDDGDAGEWDDEAADVDGPEDSYDDADDEDELDDDEDEGDEQPVSARRGGGRRSPVSRAGR